MNVIHKNRGRAIDFGTWVVQRETASKRLYPFLLAGVHVPPSIL